MNCFLYFYDVNMNEKKQQQQKEQEKRLVPKGAKTKSKKKSECWVKHNIVETGTSHTLFTVFYYYYYYVSNIYTDYHMQAYNIDRERV